MQEEENRAAFFKRRKYLVKSGFQLRYTGVILLFVLFTVLFSGAIIYFTIFPYLSEKLANVYPQSRLVEVLTMANMRLLYGLAFLIPISIWLGVMLSHKIAGPWYRLEVAIKDMVKGNIEKDVIMLRKDDELKSLAEAINELVMVFKKSEAKACEHIGLIEQDVLKLSNELKKQQLDLPAITRTISEINNLVLAAKSDIQ